ncbi:MAG: ABC transporter ATP-binding protein [Alphaproteobacteria bacterium]
MHLVGSLITDIHQNKITVKNLTVSYGNTLAIENISGSFEPGSLTAIVGPNGGGKSTFLKALQKLVKPSKGSVIHHCLHVCDRAYLPQQTDLDSSFPLTVYDVVGMGLWRRRGAFKSYKAEDHTKIMDALNKVGLQGFEQKLIGNLSGGQFQRMLFARIILQDSSLIILDEPFNSIDHQTYMHLMDLIKEWHQKNKTIIIALHNLDLVREFFPQTLLIGRCCVGWGPTKKILTDAHIKQSFTNLMV